MMATIAKGLMLAAVMTVGAQNVQAQNEESKLAPADANEWWQGEELKGNGQEVYLYNVGAGVFVTNNTPSEKDINNATLWSITDSYKFTTADNGIYLYYSWGWKTGVGATSEATKFNLKISENTKDKGYAYKLYIKPSIGKNRYFNIDQGNNKYTAAESTGPWNDFLFISAEQKEAYSEYADLYKEANTYTSNEKVSATLLSDLKDVLTNASKSTYASYSSDKTNLKDIIKQIEDYLKSHTTGIDEVANTNNIKQTAIYNANGVRISKMQKGINIVKMSNGENQKVLVK